MLPTKVKTFVDLYRRQRELEMLECERYCCDNGSRGELHIHKPSRRQGVGLCPIEVIGKNVSTFVPEYGLRKQQSMLQRKLEGAMVTRYDTRRSQKAVEDLP